MQWNVGKLFGKKTSQSEDNKSVDSRPKRGMGILRKKAKPDTQPPHESAVSSASAASDAPSASTTSAATSSAQPKVLTYDDFLPPVKGELGEEGYLESVQVRYNHVNDSYKKRNEITSEVDTFLKGVGEIFAEEDSSIRHKTIQAAQAFFSDMKDYLPAPQLDQCLALGKKIQKTSDKLVDGASEDRLADRNAIMKNVLGLVAILRDTPVKENYGGTIRKALLKEGNALQTALHYERELRKALQAVEQAQSAEAEKDKGSVASASAQSSASITTSSESKASETSSKDISTQPSTPEKATAEAKSKAVNPEVIQSMPEGSAPKEEGSQSLLQTSPAILPEGGLKQPEASEEVVAEETAKPVLPESEKRASVTQSLPETAGVTADLKFVQSSPASLHGDDIIHEGMTKAENDNAQPDQQAAIPLSAASSDKSSFSPVSTLNDETASEASSSASYESMREMEPRQESYFDKMRAFEGTIETLQDSLEDVSENFESDTLKDDLKAVLKRAESVLRAHNVYMHTKGLDPESDDNIVGDGYKVFATLNSIGTMLDGYKAGRTSEDAMTKMVDRLSKRLNPKAGEETVGALSVRTAEIMNPAGDSAELVPMGKGGRVYNVSEVLENKQKLIDNIEQIHAQHDLGKALSNALALFVHQARTAHSGFSSLLKQAKGAPAYRAEGMTKPVMGELAGSMEKISIVSRYMKGLEEGSSSQDDLLTIMREMLTQPTEAASA